MIFFLETLYYINHLTHACEDFGRGVLLLACMPYNAVIIPQNDESVPKTRSFAKESMRRAGSFMMRLVHIELVVSCCALYTSPPG